MSVGSINTAVSSPSAQAIRPQNEAAEVTGAPDRDGDADDGGGKAVQAPAPVINLNGQTLGQIVNVTA